jgi:hypothetical protein
MGERTFRTSSLRHDFLIIYTGLAAVSVKPLCFGVEFGSEEKGCASTGAR